MRRSPPRSSLEPIPAGAPSARGHRKIQGRAGFTLIEVLAAFVLIVLILPAVARGISACVKAGAQGKALIEAATLADGKLAELVASPGWESQMLSGDFSPERPEYRWSASSISYDDYLLEVMVIVTWNEPGRERSFSLSSLVYQGEQ